jgi:hypothetical protein
MMAGEYVRSRFVVWQDPDGIHFLHDSPGGLFRIAAALLLWLGISGCCVAPPRAEDLFAVGFRTPEQAFSTFQTAVRADDPGLLRRCLSSDFIARNKLSEQVLRVFWEQQKQEQPFLRLGISDARTDGPVEFRGSRARMRAKSHGRGITMTFAREEFCEAWGGREKLADESAPFRERTGVQPDGDGGRWIYGRMPLPAGIAPERVTELRFGQEWKIDGFAVDDEASRESGHEASPGDRKNAGDADGFP